MKKLAAAAAVAIFGALILVYFYGQTGDKDWKIVPKPLVKKTVEITEISEDLFTQDMIRGQWVLYLYYPGFTKTLELMVDQQGTAAARTSGIDEAMSVVLGKDGDLEMHGPSLDLKGTMDKTREHLDGMAVVRDASSPIPFSCFKIGAYRKGGDSEAR